MNLTIKLFLIVSLIHINECTDQITISLADGTSSASFVLINDDLPEVYGTISVINENFGLIYELILSKLKSNC